MALNKIGTITRLCDLVTNVGAHFGHQHPHDCFCTNNHQVIDRVEVSELLLEFIEEAVIEKIEKDLK